jgi:hypothetical protein
MSKLTHLPAFALAYEVESPSLPANSFDLVKWYSELTVSMVNDNNRRNKTL